MRRIIIVGQGIAGTCLARSCDLTNLDFIIIDNNHKSSSSMVAAGMWNPLVFRKLTKSWNIDLLLPFALRFYQTLENDLDQKILHEYKICKLFNSVREGNDWELKSDENGFVDFMNSHALADVEAAPIINEFGYGVVEHAGRINLPNLLGAYQEDLKKRGKIILTEFDFDKLNHHDSGVEYYGEFYDAVVFCEGAAVLQNSFFNWLPFQPNKGELITIFCPDLKVESLLNKGFFILPLGDDKYRVGATFSINDQSTGTSENSLNWIVGKLKNVIQCSYEILDHKSGIRPTVSDRKPLLGRHPEYKNLYLLNGMGTKGVVIAPLMSDLLRNLMMHNEPLPQDVDLQRFSLKSGD